MKKLLLVLAVFASPALAQQWTPTKPVRIVVPIQGGTVDILARLVQPRLQEAFGQPVIVENKAGAGGNLGTDFVAKSDPDGSTILAGYTGPITVNVTLFGNLPYDPQKDLAPITLTVNPGVPFNSVAELVAYAKANPGKLSYGSVGVGSASHLTMEMFKSAASVNIVHIPYKGSAPNVTDLLGGQVQLSFLVPGNVLPHLGAGKLKVLAVSGRKRFGASPNTPTMIEAGFPDFEAIAWIGFLAPGGTPRPIVERYNRELVRILNSPDVRQKLLDIQFEIVAGTPEQFAEYIRWETPRWARVIKATGAKAN
jgi:tripartite-type tricarboxylate transporter receptor subunit TctC